MAAHAILAPSSAHRWLACPPSAQLEAQFPDTQSESAAEGSFAHEWAEIHLRSFLGELQGEKLHKEVERLKSQKNRYHKDETYWNPNLEDYVEEYTSTVINHFLEAQENDRGAALLLEQRLDFQEWVPEGFGRGDAVILADGTMEILDLKYGRNVAVTAVGNPQLRLYALGAYQELSCLYDIQNVTMTIVQPRNGGVSTETLTAKELLAWGESIKPIAVIAMKGKGEFKAGEHCLFCRAKNRCKALAEYQMSIAKDDFDDPDQLSDEEVAEVIRRVDDFVKWANSVKDYALSEAINNNKKWPGWKLVEGKSRRAISDTDKAAEILAKEGIAEDKIWKPKELQGITNLEKAVGKKKLGTLLADVIVKPAGKPTLVPEDDPREEWNAAKNDFDELPDEEGE